MLMDAASQVFWAPSAAPPCTRYFFDIDDGVEHRDEIGRELLGGEFLRAEALRVASGLMTAEAEDAKETTLVLTVRDETGATALKIRVVCQVEDF